MRKKRLALLFVFSVVLIIILLLNSFGLIHIPGKNITGMVVGSACTSSINCSANEFCLNNLCARTCAHYTTEINCTTDPLSIAINSNNNLILQGSNYSILPVGGFCNTGVNLVYQGNNMTVISCSCSWANNVCGDSPVLESVQNQGQCVVNWTEHNTNCANNDEYIIYYLDENHCNVSTFKPSNKTQDCDYNQNGLIGDVDDASITRYNIYFEVAGEEFDFSSNYSGTKKIELFENNSLIVDFNWNFNNAFNFKLIELAKQTNNGDKGYIIINGINVNKTVYLDRIAEASKVCIKDNDVDSINDFSSDCNASDEVVLDCPGSDEGYVCSIVNNSLKISGLMHSAVIEYLGDTFATCDTNWSCIEWSDCVSGEQTRTCVDLNDCNSSFGKPLETQSCEAGCISSWSCIEWSDCVSGEQTRTCVDLNDCVIETNKPEEQRECEVSNVNWKLILGVLGVLILLAVVVSIILYFLNKQAEEGDGSDNLNGGSIPPTQPPVIPGSVQAPRPSIVQKPIQQPRPSMTRPMPRNTIPVQSVSMS